MKPGDHPEFFRFKAPEGRSRESSIRLDRAGTFWHDGAIIERSSMRRAFFGWIRRHPDDGRFILENGYDWTYFTVEDVPFFIETVRLSDGPTGPEVTLVLSDGSEEPIDPTTLRVGEGDALYVAVKNGAFEARFTPSSQNALAPLLTELSEGDDVGLRLGDRTYAIDLRRAPASAK